MGCSREEGLHLSSFPECEFNLNVLFVENGFLVVVEVVVVIVLALSGAARAECGAITCASCTSTRNLHTKQATLTKSLLFHK